MNDIFLSYHSSDRATAQLFADEFEARGWSVWWDREIPIGKNFDRVIEEQLTAADCVVVLWSKESINSRWVRTEASTAADGDRLVPVLIEDTVIPLEFRQIQAAQLPGWNGDTNDPEFIRLVSSIEAHVSPGPVAGLSVPRIVQASFTHRTRRVLPAILATLIVLGIVSFSVLLFGPQRQRDADSVADNDVAGNPSTEVEAVAQTQPIASGPNNPVSIPEHANPAIAVKIGDRIADNVPVQGAGRIESPFTEDLYSFTAQRGQRVYFRMLEYDSSLGGIYWRLVDPQSREVFNTCLACSEPGVQLLSAGGQYTLTVGTTMDPATGTYRLRLYDVPQPSQFTIKIGDTIQQGFPGEGAGAIESPGAEDVFTFTAAPQQRVYFRKIDQSREAEFVEWKLLDDDDETLFSICLACTEPGVRTLQKGGEYRLIVGQHNNPATGTYRLQLTDVPRPDRFLVSLPVRISNSSPGPGAGLIETSGAQDIFIFNAVAGQVVSFNLVDYEKTLTYNEWQLLDNEGQQLFKVCFACTAPGLQRLSRAGEYTLIVGSTAEPSSGTYTIDITAQ